MAESSIWIKSHKNLRDNPKLFVLMAVMVWNRAEAIGRLHMLWWWCVDHAEDGDLRRFDDMQIAMAVELDATKSKQFIEALLKGGFLEREPYFRIHNWWKYAGRYLQSKYKDHPEKWKVIQEKYASCVTDTVTDGVTDEEDRESHMPQNKNKIKNKTPIVPTGDGGAGKKPEGYSEHFIEFWRQYPKKVGKKAAWRAWERVGGLDEMHNELRGRIFESVLKHKKTEQWRKDGGQFIPHPATFLNQARWDDEISEKKDRRAEVYAPMDKKPFNVAQGRPTPSVAGAAMEVGPAVPLRQGYGGQVGHPSTGGDRGVEEEGLKRIAEMIPQGAGQV